MAQALGTVEDRELIIAQRRRRWVETYRGRKERREFRAFPALKTLPGFTADMDATGPGYSPMDDRVYTMINDVRKKRAEQNCLRPPSPGGKGERGGEGDKREPGLSSRSQLGQWGGETCIADDLSGWR